MKLYSSIKSEDFNYNVVPHLLVRAVNSMYSKNKHNGITHNLDTYLKNSYGLSIVEVLNQLNTCLRVGEVANEYIIEIDQNKRLGEHNLYMLFRLINYGNASIKGTNIIDDAIKYVSRRLNIFYRFYMKGGFKYGN